MCQCGGEGDAPWQKRVLRCVGQGGTGQESAEQFQMPSEGEAYTNARVCFPGARSMFGRSGRVPIRDKSLENW